MKGNDRGFAPRPSRGRGPPHLHDYWGSQDRLVILEQTKKFLPYVTGPVRDTVFPGTYH
ncbi:MAG TPA: hypothetical protein VM327_03780 [Candidatus Thermoplasmatota archaeon]|nr:hypothetical protein [Candidatus Thermoplasmatota archaeon]